MPRRARPAGRGQRHQPAGGAELLEDAGLVVDVADNGESARAAGAAGPYDLVLMDMQMPVMDGVEATRRDPQAAGLRPTADRGDDGQRDGRRPRAAWTRA